MIKSSKSGFTLAEVLTTLMVIGVVAAMTIPTLMNSTQEQTARAATKKAMSVLSQGAQLILASDADCTFEDSDEPTSEELATCMHQVIAGTQEAGQDGNNRIKTNDGMEYEFIVPDGATGSDLTTVCGRNFGQYNGKNTCLVVVDVMAGKGAHLADEGYDYAKNTGLADSPETSLDIVAFTLSAQGARPYGVPGGSDANNAFRYLYGESAIPDLHYCLAKTNTAAASATPNYVSSKCTSGTNNGKYFGSPIEVNGNCATNYDDVTEAEVVENCNP